MSIGALVSAISLNLTSSLVTEYGVVAATLPITGATATTPILLTVPNHGFPIPQNGQPPNRVCHGVVSGVTGVTAANGVWILTPVDANTLSVSGLTAQGLPFQPAGTGVYAGGGTVQYAFPQGQILLGARNLPNTAGVATPNIVFVPTTGKAWGFEPYGGGIPNIGPASVPQQRGTLEEQAGKLEPQLATQFTTFKVYVSGCGEDYGDARSPDYYDFDATQAIVWALYAVLFDGSGSPRAKVLSETWPSQDPSGATQLQRGQQWMGVIEFQQAVVKPPQSFVPAGTSLQVTVEPVNPGPTDPIVIAIP